MKYRILVVEDTRAILNTYADALAREYDVRVASGSEAAVRQTDREGADLALVGASLEGADGYEVCRRLRALPAMRDIPILLVSERSAAEDGGRGFDAGATDYVGVPIHATELKARVRAHLQSRAFAERAMGSRPKAHDASTGRVDKTALQTVSRSFVEMVMRLVLTVELRDPNAGLHAIRVGKIAGAISRAMGLPEDFQQGLAFAAPLHDIGHVMVPHEILTKPGPLSEAEWREVEKHPTVGGRILSHSRARVVSLARIVAQTHHERWNGSGYPAGLSGEGIPLSGRIVALADAYDSMRTARPYRDAMSHDEAVTTIGVESGKHFDPTVVAAFLKLGGEVERIRAQLHDQSPDALERRLASKLDLDLPDYLIVTDVTESSISG